MEFIRSLYLNTRLFVVLGLNTVLFILAYFYPILFNIALIGIFIISTLCVIDVFMLYRTSEGICGERETPERFANGDENDILIHISNNYLFQAQLEIVDEIPHQFQIRNTSFRFILNPQEKKSITYQLRPVQRGEYIFGSLNVYASTPLSFGKRRFTFSEEKKVPTYPSYIQMRRYQMMAISNRLPNLGIKKTRRLGHTTEFEHIKSYVNGDDYRTINWKATARTGKLMVNQYIEERAQNIYCIIDKSRAMRMPFEGMSLLDYAINSSLVLANIAIFKKDKAGLITFAEKIDTSVAADRKSTQMSLIMEVLYKQKTQFLEADYSRLYTFVKHKIAQRSLLVLFTNFESLNAMRRQLPYLQRLSKQHLLMIVFFENTELHTLIKARAQKTEEIYIKTIAENFAFEKQQIAKELRQYGIIAILCPPKELTVNIINKYLGLKSRGMI